MELNIKNERLIAFLEEHQQQGEKHRNESGKNPGNPVSTETTRWFAAHPESVAYGYFESLMDVAERHGIELDLTYDTLKNLSPAIVALYGFQKKYALEVETNAPMRDSKNKDIICKTIAAYLTLLAMNEHNFWFSAISTKKPNEGMYPWGGHVSIRTGKKKNVDLLHCCKQAAVPGLILPPQGGMSIQIAPIVAEYEKMTGVKLSDHGLANIFIG